MTQETIDDWFSNLPAEIEKYYAFLSENVKKFQTFDLLAYFSYYNHLHSTETYTDYRGDKSFIASEVIALLCLKNDFVNECTISEDKYMDLIVEMQKTILSYCGRKDAMEFKFVQKLRGEDPIADIASILTSESKQIRNLGLPDHHYIFVEKLLEPIKDEIESIFSFTVSDSIKIRKDLPEMVNKKCNAAIDEAISKAGDFAKEIIKYRKTKTIETGSVFSKAQLDEYCLLPDKKLKIGLKGHVLNELFYTFGTTFTFTAEELAEFTKIKLEAVTSFLKTFSCNFPSLKQDDEIYGPFTILRSKPLIEHEGRYLVPSMPLLVWAVEDVIEVEIKKNRRLNEKYPIIKHEFLLKTGLEYFKTLLPTARIYRPNLFYYLNNDLCETDGIIIYDRVLFIVEAKANRISSKAKKGHELKTQDHLKDIVRDSYSQGIRTLNYIENSETADFRTKNGEQVLVSRKDFDDIIIVSLTLEPIGSLAMSIKATNDLGYFNNDHFPWIISLYDLVVLADLFENPIMLIHYIKRRRNFLSHEILSTYEELDLVSYFLYNGLSVESTLKDAQENKVNRVEFSPDTDAINDYYMFKFGHKTKATLKPKIYISNEFNNFLLHLDNSEMPHRVRMALLILEFNEKSIKKLMDFIRKTKLIFSKDRGIHDCSIYTYSLGGLGVTYMTGINKPELDFKLHRYCNYKLLQQNSNIWIGLGDVATNREIYDFRSMFFASREKII